MRVITNKQINYLGYFFNSNSIYIYMRINIQYMCVELDMPLTNKM